MNKGRIITLLIFIITLAFVVFVGGTMPYFLLYILLLLFIFPLLHCLIVLKGISGYVIIPNKSLFSGEKVHIEYEIRNDSFLPIPYLEIHSNITKQLTGNAPPKLVLSLDKKSSFSNKEDFTIKRRGYYEIGEISVTIRDVLGFYTFNKTVSSTASLLVYPKKTNISTFRIIASQQSGEAVVQDSVFQDRSQVASLKDYREGDSIKAIHWKLSAKKETPVIKEFENRGDTYATIFMDNESILYKNDMDRRLEDKAVEVAVSIIDYCLNQNIEIGLETQNDNKHISIKGQQKSDAKPFLEALAKFKGNGALDFASYASTITNTLAKNSTVIVITPNFDKKMGAQGIQLKMKNYNPIFIVITDMINETGYVDHAVEEMLKDEGIPVFVIDCNANTKEALEVKNG